MNMHVADRDANGRFLCTYGNFPVSAYYFDFSGSSFASTFRHVAVPVIGHGQTVRRIRVIEAQASGTLFSAFTVGIYSNTASGLPGNPIAVGKGKTGPTCGPVKISIPRTTLKTNQKYWIEERTSTPACYNSICSSFADLYWEADPNTKRRAYVQTHHFSSSAGGRFSSYTSPWTKQTKGPYFKLR